MKKYVYVLLLILPLIILGIVNLSSTVLARLIPVAVKDIVFSETEVIGSIGSTKQLDVIFTPARAQNKNVTYYSTDEEIATVDSTGLVHYLQYGYCEIIAVSEDGKYEAVCDVNIKNPSDNPSDIKAIVLQYKESIHGDYRFGNLNALNLSYKIYPKDTAVDDVVFNIDGGVATKNSDKTISITFNSEGSHLLTATSSNTGVSATYNFDVYNGYNLTNGDEINNVKQWINEKKDIYLLEDYSIYSPLTFGGMMIYGNGKKIDHSSLPHYEDKSLSKNVNAITLLSNAILDNCRIVGKVKDDMTLYDIVVNVSMNGTSTIKNCIIENGKYNISTYGRSVSYNDGTDYHILDTKCIGSSYAAIQVNNAVEDGYRVLSTELFIRDLYYDYTNVGILVENSQSSNEDEVKGYSKVTILKSKTTNKDSITTNNDNWLNIDAVSGSVESLGFGYLIDELRDHSEFVKKDKYGDYYVNCAILVNGGRRNISEVILEDNCVLENLEYVERVPKSLEAMQLGGNEKFRAYLFKSSLCNF